MPELLWAPQAWVDGRWREAVLLAVGADGHWAAVQPDSAPPPQAERLPGAVLPGLVDAHSHAFQRAFVGLAERRSAERDDFWGWGPQRDGQNMLGKLWMEVRAQITRSAGRET